VKRSERLIVLTRMLVEHPGVSHGLNDFSRVVGGAKSTLSEDLALIRQVLDEQGLGRIQTLTGAGGGVTYIPALEVQDIEEKIQELCQELSSPRRILPGDFIYMADILYSPVWAWDIGRIFAEYFRPHQPEFVLTMETKGIPLATMTARALNCPLLIIRRAHHVTEGPAVSINYISGSSRNIDSMSLPRRALPTGARVVLVDDFMKAGGTARGMLDLMQEFQARVQGIGVVMATADPAEKLVEDYLSLLTLGGLEDRRVDIRPSENGPPGSGVSKGG